MTKAKINCEVPDLVPGEVRVMFDDGEGAVIMDFEKGKVNTELRELVHDYLNNSKL